MPLTLSEEIRETFRKVALQNEAAHGLNSDDWAQYRRIEAEHEQRLRREYRDHASEYDAKIEQVRRRLVDEAGKKNRALTRRLFGRDGFDSDVLERQAHRIVQADHTAALKTLEAERQDRINTLLDAVDDRHALGNRLKGDFEKATDRGSEQERRRDPPR